jgi:hypothetical protein
MKKNVWLPLVAAVGWAALLLPAALYIPIENPQRFSYQVDGHTVNRWVSLVRDNGDQILLVVAIPLILSLIATCFLTLQSRSKGRVFGWIARCLGVLLLAGAFVGTATFLVGIFVVPGGVFLLVSCTNSHRNQALTSSSLNALSESRRLPI